MPRGANMGRIVVKFGGSSLADADQFKKVRDIILSDPERDLAVVSAPGKRHDRDFKVTDMLYQIHTLREAGLDYRPQMNQIIERFVDIKHGLHLHIHIETHLNDIMTRISAGASIDYIASRGEYLSGLLMADYLEWDLIDPAGYILFHENGRFNADATQQVFSEKLRNVSHAVIPGFYGSMPDGQIRTFSRGGSDITGAIAACAAYADMYENWTDVSGFLMADPRIVNNPCEIESITYRELRELSYSGATVLHEDSVFPVHRAGIPTNIRNTNHPDHPGSFISYNASNSPPRFTITGIAGKKGFSVISIEKAMMNAELGFGRRVLEAVEKEGISFEHLPTGIDTMCIVVASDALEGKREKVTANIIAMAEPDTITIHDHMPIIATVGRGMVRAHGTAARLFHAMSREGINVRMIDQGSSEISIIVGVDESDFNQTIRAIYDEFVK